MQVELDQTQLIEAVATKIADRLLADGKWLSHAYQAMWDRAEKTLKNREDPRKRWVDLCLAGSVVEPTHFLPLPPEVR